MQENLTSIPSATLRTPLNLPCETGFAREPLHVSSALPSPLPAPPSRICIYAAFPTDARLPKPLFLLPPPPAATPRAVIKKVNETCAPARGSGGPVVRKGPKGLNFLRYSVGSASVQNGELLGVKTVIFDISAFLLEAVHCN